VTVIDVAVDAFTVAVTPPKVTDVGELRFVPLIVIEAPPEADPVLGEMVAMSGKAT
jgi:hypothetical protein